MFRNIETSEKNFVNQKKCYTNAIQAFNEFTTNAFFAPNASDVKIQIDTKTSDNVCFCVINNGDPMSKDEINNAISILGCDSKKTAGNENGTGIKSAASYFSRFQSSILFLGSKNGGEQNVGVINPKGQYGDYEDLTKEQKRYVDRVMSRFDYGTVVGVFNTDFDGESAKDFYDKLCREIAYTFTTGLLKVKFSVQFDSNPPYHIEYIDRMYGSIRPTILVNDSSEKLVSFVKDGKTYSCTIISIFLKKIPEKYLNGYDAKDITKDWGVHMGYENGYMPIHESNASTIGVKATHHNLHTRHMVIAHPIELPGCAGVEDWKKLYSQVGRMNLQKVPNFNTPFNFFKRGRGASKSVWRGFCDAVVNEFTSFVSSTIGKTPAAQYTNNELIELNKFLQKRTFMCPGSSKPFGFKAVSQSSFGDSTDIAKYDVRNQLLILKFEQNELFDKLTKGGRNNRNGRTELVTAIEPFIDMLKGFISLNKDLAGAKNDFKRFAAVINETYAD